MFTTRRVLKNLSLLSVISVLLFLFSVIASAQTCDDNMTSYWKLVEDGNTIDYVDSVGGNSAYCLTDCPAPSITGITNINGSQEFDGVDDEVIADADGTFDWGLSESFSIEFWINTSGSTAGNRVFVGRDDPSTDLHWWVGAAANGKVRFQLQDTSGNGINTNKVTDGGPALNDGLWHHIVAVRNETGDLNSIYVDAMLVDSTSYDYLAGFDSSTELNMGHLNSQYRYNGILD